MPSAIADRNVYSVTITTIYLCLLYLVEIFMGFWY